MGHIPIGKLVHHNCQDYINQWSGFWRIICQKKLPVAGPVWQSWPIYNTNPDDTGACWIIHDHDKKNSLKTVSNLLHWPKKYIFSWSIFSWNIFHMWARLTSISCCIWGFPIIICLIISGFCIRFCTMGLSNTCLIMSGLDISCYGNENKNNKNYHNKNISCAWYCSWQVPIFYSMNFVGFSYLPYI